MNALCCGAPAPCARTSVALLGRAGPFGPAAEYAIALDRCSIAPAGALILSNDSTNACSRGCDGRTGESNRRGWAARAAPQAIDAARTLRARGRANFRARSEVVLGAPPDLEDRQRVDRRSRPAFNRQRRE